jgi:hypothetical protein
VRSSRRIERACVEDVACRVIVAQQRPDHATIARFVERHERALADLFGEVLALRADAGLVTVGVIAIDGTKVSANANRDRTLDYEQDRQKSPGAATRSGSSSPRRYRTARFRPCRSRSAARRSPVRSRRGRACGWPHTQRWRAAQPRALLEPRLGVHQPLRT